MDEFRMDEIELDEMEFDKMEQDDVDLDESLFGEKNCCAEKKEKIEPCDKLIVKTKEIAVNLDNCSGRLILVPVVLENVCKNIPVNVAVIVCEKWKVIGMVIKQLVGKKHSHSPCVKIRETFCIPIDTDICEKTHLNIKVIAAYAPKREKCPDCDCDRGCDCDCEDEIGSI